MNTRQNNERKKMAMANNKMDFACC